MIKEYNNFLTEEECSMLIGLGESGQLNAGLIKSGVGGYRKAKVRWFDEHPLIQKVKNRVAELSGTSIDKQETFHFVKYISGGEYRPHFDGSYRCKTALIYLNTGYTGGETHFVNIDKIIKPELGKLIIWDNMTETGENDEDSFHAGLPVEFGTKYIGVIWIKK